MYPRSISTPLTAAEIPAASFGATFPGSYCSAMWFFRFARSAAADTGIHVYMQAQRQSLAEVFMKRGDSDRSGGTRQEPSRIAPPSTPAWNPGGTPELKKWSGRQDSNQRPPAPKFAVLRPSAMLRNDCCSQISDLKRLDARNRRTCSITLRIGTLLEPAEISLSRRK